MKKILLYFVLLNISISGFAQKTIKGKVFDANNNTPLAGATISFANQSIITESDGSFSIDCSKGKSVTVTFIGYDAYTQPINCDGELSIALTPSNGNLNDALITSTSNPKKSVLYQPVSISKLNQKELKRGIGLFLDDAINTNVPGVIMQRRTVSAGQQLNIRGYGNGSRGTRGISSNFDGQGYKVYLNDIPITDAEGITLMDDIDFGSVANVEITKGPAGTLYGQAIAGAVNLRTISAERGKTSISQEVMIGNYGLQRFTTQFQRGGEHSSILINYGNQKTDGYMSHTASQKQFVNFIGDFQPNAKQSITTYFGYSNSYDERGGELTIAQYQNKDYSGNIDYIKRNGHSNVISFRAGLGHTYSFCNNVSNTTTLFATGLNSNVSSAGGWTDKAPINLGLRSTFNTKFFLNNSITLSGITGIETQRQNANTIGYNLKQNPADTTTNGWSMGKPYWVINAITSNVFTITATTAGFTEWTLALPKDFSVTAGIGISNMKVVLDDRFNTATATKPSRFDTTYKNMVSPHIAINKVFNKRFSVYASYSTGYKAPVSSYFFITTPVVANPATPATGRINSVLKPEKGTQFEIGTKGTLFNDRLIYQLAAFNTKFSNKMTTVAVQLNSTTTAYTYMVNGGEQIHNGIEALLKYTIYRSNNNFFTNITPFVNLTYSDFKYGDNFKFQSGSTVNNITTTDYSNKQVAGVPKIATNAGVDIYTKPGVYANITYSYRDGFPITSDGIYNTTSYNLVNAKLGFKRTLSRHVDLDAYFGVSNITGVQYPLMVFVNQIPDAYLPAPLDANYFGGINFRYNF